MRSLLAAVLVALLPFQTVAAEGPVESDANLYRLPYGASMLVHKQDGMPIPLDVPPGYYMTDHGFQKMAMEFGRLKAQADAPKEISFSPGFVSLTVAFVSGMLLGAAIGGCLGSDGCRNLLFPSQ